MISDRSVKVFVSSTFLDMQAERDMLANHIFPRLRAFCESRGIIWREVDLRWGITDEQALNGQIIPICLAEIDDCRPYFIGILGERYGWTGFDIPDEVIKQYHWLTNWEKYSITEIEFEYGAFQDPSKANHAFFYFKAKNNEQSLLKVKKDDFQKLEGLKSRVESSNLPILNDYPDPIVFGEQVYVDLRGAIEEDFPDAQLFHPLEKDFREHLSYALSRTRVYVKLPQKINVLNNHLRIDSSPIVVTGASGSGKSAFLVNWVENFKRDHPNQRVAQYYIGSSTLSTSWRQLALSILWQLGQPIEHPDLRAEDLRQTFARRLDKIANNGGAIIIIDALNQLDDTEGALDLVWLPPVLPVNIKLVMSTLSGRTLDKCRIRQYQEMTIDPLTITQRKRLINRYLKIRYAKTLNAKSLTLIITHQLAGNPLWLITILEELRLYGDHHTLKARISYYLHADSIENLFSLVIDRWETEYNQQHENFVENCLTFIWAARRGITESELKEIFTINKKPISGLLWSTFLFAVDYALVARSGLYSFFHQYLKNAVEKRFLHSKKKRNKAHQALINYFNKQEFSSRIVEELPWQYQVTQAWSKLFKLLTNSSFFRAAWETNELDLKMYWAQLEKETTYHRTKGYQPVITKTIEHLGISGQVSILLKESGNLHEALAIEENLANHYQQERNDLEWAQSLTTIGQIVDLLGDSQKALSFHYQAEKIYRRENNRKALLISLGEQAHIQFNRGNSKQAIAFYDEAEELARQEKDRASHLSILLGKAEIFTWIGYYFESEQLITQAERIGKELGDRDGLQRAFGHLANLKIQQERFHEALEPANKKEKMASELGDQVSQGTALATLSLINQHLNDYDKAFEFNIQAINIFETLQYRRNIADSYSNQGCILLALGAKANNQKRIAEAKALFERAASIYNELGDKLGLDIILNNQAKAAEQLEKYDTALQLYNKAIEAAVEEDSQISYAKNLCNKASLLHKMNQSALAYDTLKSAQEIFKDLGNLSGLSRCMNLMADVLETSNKMQEAFNAARISEKYARQAKSPKAIGHALERQANLLEKAGQFEKALKIKEEQLLQWEEANDLNNLYLSQGKVVELASFTGDVGTMLKTLRSQAITLTHLGRLSELREGIAQTIATMEGRNNPDAQDQQYLAGLKQLLKELETQ